MEKWHSSGMLSKNRRSGPALVVDDVDWVQWRTTFRPTQSSTAQHRGTVRGHIDTSADKRILEPQCQVSIGIHVAFPASNPPSSTPCTPVLCCDHEFSLLLSLRSSDLEICALGWLGQLLVRGRGHVPANLDEDRLHGKVTLPDTDAWEFREIDLLHSQHQHFSSFARCEMLGQDDRTLPVLWSTHGRLTLLRNVTSGGRSG